MTWEPNRLLYCISIAMLIHLHNKILHSSAFAHWYSLLPTMQANNIDIIEVRGRWFQLLCIFISFFVTYSFRFSLLFFEKILIIIFHALNTNLSCVQPASCSVHDSAANQIIITTSLNRPATTKVRQINFALFCLQLNCGHSFYSSFFSYWIVSEMLVRFLLLRAGNGVVVVVIY
jgi:hypothetical protein